MQFPFETLDNGAIAVRRPIGNGATHEYEPVRVTPNADPLVLACQQAAAESARENVIWLVLFLSALLLLTVSFAL